MKLFLFLLFYSVDLARTTHYGANIKQTRPMPARGGPRRRHFFRRQPPPPPPGPQFEHQHKLYEQQKRLQDTGGRPDPNGGPPGHNEQGVWQGGGQIDGPPARQEGFTGTLPKGVTLPGGATPPDIKITFSDEVEGGGGGGGGGGWDGITWTGTGPGPTRGPFVTTPEVFTVSRTYPGAISFYNDCDYLAFYCMRLYQTGRVCGATYYFTYHTFSTYCLLDYVNCMERYDLWRIAYMGECRENISMVEQALELPGDKLAGKLQALDAIEELQHYKHYPYENDYFLDQYYPIEYGHPG